MVVLDTIRAVRPELYEHLLNEAKKRSEKPGNYLATVDLITEFSFRDAPRRIENKIIVQEKEETFVYLGEATGLNYSKKSVCGEARLTKYCRRKKDRKEWRIRTYWYSGTQRCEFLSDKIGEIGYYRKILNQAADSNGLVLPTSLIDAVFNPIDQILAEIYKQIERIK